MENKRKLTIQEMQDILKQWAEEARLKANSPATFEQAEQIFNSEPLPWENPNNSLP